MKKNRSTLAAVVAGAMLLGTSSPALAVESPSAAAPATTYSASAAYQVAAQDVTVDGEASPTAVPAIVGTAFVAGAAAGAGKVVAGWAAKKVIGIWAATPELSSSMLD